MFTQSRCPAGMREQGATGLLESVGSDWRHWHSQERRCTVGCTNFRQVCLVQTVRSAEPWHACWEEEKRTELLSHRIMLTRLSPTESLPYPDRKREGARTNTSFRTLLPSLLQPYRPSKTAPSSSAPASHLMERPTPPPPHPHEGSKRPKK